MRPFYLFLFLVLFLPLSHPALGLKLLSECHDSRAYPLASEQIPCYHSAALSMAYLNDPSTAVQICQSIFTNWGTSGSSPDDLQLSAEMESNNCYLDVARVSGDTSICNRITSHRDDALFGLTGEGTTQELCTDLASKTSNRMGQNFFNRNTSICAFVYILPALLLGAIYAKK